jgi:hypothetical protein
MQNGWEGDSLPAIDARDYFKNMSSIPGKERQ